MASGQFSARLLRLTLEGLLHSRREAGLVLHPSGAAAGRGVVATPAALAGKGEGMPLHRRTRDPGTGDVGGMVPFLAGGDKCFWRKDVGY